MVVLPTPPLPTMPTFTAIPPSINTYESCTYVGQGTTQTTTDQRSVPGARLRPRLDAAHGSPTFVRRPLAPSPGFLVRSAPTLHQAGRPSGRLPGGESADAGCRGC